MFLGILECFRNICKVFGRFCMVSRAHRSSGSF